MEVYRTFRIHASRFLPKLDDNHICKKMHGHTFNITVFAKGEINNKDGQADNIYKKEEVSHG